MATRIPGITQLPSGRFQWRVMVGGISSNGTCDTLPDAQRARLDAQLADPERRRRAGAPTVAEVLSWWLADSGNAKTTAKRRDVALKFVPATFMAARASSIGAPEISALYRTLIADGRGPDTVAKVRNAMSKAWGQAVEWGELPSNPWRGVRLPAVPPRRATFPPVAEVRRALELAAGVDAAHGAFVRLMAICGTRPGEACGLRWDGVDLERSLIAVGRSITGDGEITDGKNGPRGWREVTVDLPTVAMLRKLRAPGAVWVFGGQEPWRPDDVGRWFGRLMQVEWRLYDLRHFAASQALAAGIPVPEVARMLGDNPATVMKTYAHAIPGQDRAASAVAALLDGG